MAFPLVSQDENEEAGEQEPDRVAYRVDQERLVHVDQLEQLTAPSADNPMIVASFDASRSGFKRC